MSVYEIPKQLLLIECSSPRAGRDSLITLDCAFREVMFTSGTGTANRQYYYVAIIARRTGSNGYL